MEPQCVSGSDTLRLRHMPLLKGTPAVVLLPGRGLKFAAHLSPAGSCLSRTPKSNLNSCKSMAERGRAKILEPKKKPRIITDDSE